MRNFKRVLAVVLMLAMLLPSMVFSSSAAVEDNWTLFGGKYSASSGTYLKSKLANGFTMSENSDGSIALHFPDGNEFGSPSATYGIVAVTSKNVTPLDNLSVTVRPGENFKMVPDSGLCSNSLGVIWSVQHPIVVETIAAVKKQSDVGNLPYGLSVDTVRTNGIRGMIKQVQHDDNGILTARGDIALYMHVDNVDNSTPDPMIGTRVNIYLFDGETKDQASDSYGYRWSYTARNFMPHTGNGDNTGIYSFHETVDIRHGLTFEVIPDDTLGYKVFVNGKDFSDGHQVGYFPDNTTSITGSRGLKNLEDVINKSENYLTSLTYARGDVDLTPLVGAGNGYVTVGSSSFTDPMNTYNIDVVSINGIPAAEWTGERNTHTHSYEVVETIPASCTRQSRTFEQCACGAVKHNQFPSVVDADPCDVYSEEVEALREKSDNWPTEYPYSTFVKEQNEIILKAYWGVSDALGHDYKATRTEPTCFEDGSIVYDCSRCDATYTEVLKATGHNTTNWVVDATGATMTRSCLDCGASETKEIVSGAATEEYWTVSHRNWVSNVDTTLVNDNNTGSYEVVNSNIAVYDYAYTNGANIAKLPLNKAFSNYTTRLDGFNAGVKNIPYDVDGDGNDDYNYSTAFVWTNKADTYKDITCYSTNKTHHNTFTKAMNGFRVYNISGGEHSFFVTLVDHIWVDKNVDGDTFDKDEYQFGTKGDNVYDAVVYAAIKDGVLVGSEWAAVTVPMGDIIDITLENSLTELAFTVNGNRIVAEGMAASQLFTDAYYFGVASYGLTDSDYTAARPDITTPTGEVTLSKTTTPCSTSFEIVGINGGVTSEWTGSDHLTSAAHECTFGDWVETTAPTCSENGEKTRLCEYCGATETEVLPMLSATGVHVWGEWEADKIPSCGIPGNDIRTCSACNATETKFVAATGNHVWGEVVPTTDATCDTAGVGTKTCTVCRVTENQSIPATGIHTVDEWTQTKAPTCDEGEQTGVCTVCGKTVKEEIPAIAEHTWGEWTGSAVADCQPYTQTRTCSVCGSKDKQTVEATADHDFLGEPWVEIKAPTATEPGEEMNFCWNCFEEIYREIPALGVEECTHEWSAWNETVPATCVADGVETRTCGLCGESETQAIPANGEHAWGAWEETIAPDCMFPGEQTRECSACGATESEELPPLAEHVDEIHVEAKAATCYEDGNIEYYYCSVCGAHWTPDGMPTNPKNVIIPAQHTLLVEMPAVEPGCHHTGNIQYWICYACEGVWQDEALTQVTNIKNVILPELGGEVEHVEAKAAGCYEEGNVEYWHCATCDQYWLDAELTQLTNRLSTIIGAAHTNVAHIEAVEPACHYEGNIEYWVCNDCGAAATDELFREITNLKNVILPELGGEVEHVAAQEGDCVTDSIIEHWFCAECEQYWLDAELTQLTNRLSVVFPAPGHNYENGECTNCGELEAEHVHVLTHTPAVEAGCHYLGNVEYWYCAGCDCFFLDEECTLVTNYLSTIIPMIGSENVVHFDAIDPACHYNGNVEYWFCPDCEQYSTNEAFTELTNSHRVILPATGSENVVHFDAVEPACHYNGNIEYWFCPDCEQYATNEAFTELTNSHRVIVPALGGEVEHVEAVEATCMQEGNVEYWHCVTENGCDQYWLDAELTQITNYPSTKLGLGGHAITHHDAVKPGCHYLGNIEYWSCSVCECFWANEELTEQIAYLSTIIPELGGEVEHVAAKAPTSTEEGNIEYWHCVTENGCDKYWLDAELTQLTNRPSTILPVLENPFVDVKADQWYTEAILYCYHNGFMAGVGETEEGKVFNYKGIVDRQTFATILAAVHTKLTGEAIPEYTAEEMSFSDIDAGKWYSNAIEWAYRNGYAAGTGVGADGKPVYTRKLEVSREQLAQFFYTYAKLNGYVAEDYEAPEFDAKYTDVDRIHSWATEAMAWAVDVGLISGTGDGTTLSPRDNATRAQIAVIIMQYASDIIVDAE